MGEKIWGVTVLEAVGVAPRGYQVSVALATSDEAGRDVLLASYTWGQPARRLAAINVSSSIPVSRAIGDLHRMLTGVAEHAPDLIIAPIHARYYGRAHRV